MTNWNFADAYEVVASRIPDAPCQIQGSRVITWSEFDRRANGLAADLVASGLGKQSKVAAYLYNGPEYLETYFATFKAGCVPVNTNYRYGADEIAYLFDNADVEAVVFHAGFAPLLDKIRPQLASVKSWYAVDDGTEHPAWARHYEEVVAGGSSESLRPPWGRSGDDLLFIYTGGTTGMPKGVMWRQDDLFNVLGGGGNPILGVPPAADLDDFGARITAPGAVVIPACPLMHGTGQFSSFIAMNGGGAIVTLEGRAFDPAGLWSTVEASKANAVIIVGDAFAKPMLAELEAHPAQYDLSSLVVISSSGVMWSQETKDGFLTHMPNIILFDSLGSSEAVGMAASVSAGGQAADTAKFSLGERVHVFTDTNKELAPGDPDIGFVAISGYIPLGYYKDEEKTAENFRTIDGVRYSVPGDYAQVNEDGSLHLLGRGSVCINTGGEKVYPEEVEEVLKAHGCVADAVCVGLPDDRFGETICALVQAAPGCEIDEAELIEHVKGRLARYKAPRRVIEVDTIGRSPAGKVDYKALRERALSA